MLHRSILILGTLLLTFVDSILNKLSKPDKIQLTGMMIIVSRRLEVGMLVLSRTSLDVNAFTDLQ